jgi:hypothetical protein
MLLPSHLLSCPCLASLHSLNPLPPCSYDMSHLHGRRADQFLEEIEPLASRVPFMVLPGNHEWEWNFTHYKEMFAMPQRAAGGNLFYSFDVGPAHFAVYNTEVFFWEQFFGQDHMAAQYRWMEADLKAANRRRGETPWVFAAGHRPMCVAGDRLSGWFSVLWLG